MKFLIAVPIGAWHPFLPACLSSLAGQAAPLSVAVMDASQDPRVEAALDASGISFAYRRVGPDAGQSAAIQEAWDAVDADVLGWLNCDDILAPDVISDARAALENGDCDVVHGDSVILDGTGAVLGLHGQTGPFNDLRAPANPISQPSCFTLRRAVERVGGLNTRLQFGMDWDLWVRMALSGVRFRYVPRIWSAVYWGPETKTDSKDPRRIAELMSVALRAGGPITALKLLIGVATADSTPGSFLWRFARRRADEEDVDLGILVAARSSPRDVRCATATISVPNLSPEPSRSLHVALEGETAATARLPSGEAWSADLTTGENVAPMQSACAAGDWISLDFDASKSKARFVRAWFQTAQVSGATQAD